MDCEVSALIESSLRRSLVGRRAICHVQEDVPLAVDPTVRHASIAYSIPDQRIVTGA